MLSITIKSVELYNPIKEEFTTTKERSLVLEHSLVSISKWESKWKKAFLGKDPKTSEETLDYIKCMTISKNVDDETYGLLSQENIEEIHDYIADEMTATTITQPAGKASREIITSELIYYWMVAMQIPFECQKWHLNRLLVLVNVCNVKNQPQKKMSKREIAARNKQLNAERRAKMKTSG